VWKAAEILLLRRRVALFERCSTVRRKLNRRRRPPVLGGLIDEYERAA
jgi:hypothetical protein